MVQIQTELVEKGDPKFEEALDKQYGFQSEPDGRVISGSDWLRIFHPDIYQTKRELWQKSQVQEVN